MNTLVGMESVAQASPHNCACGENPGKVEEFKMSEEVWVKQGTHTDI